MKGDVTINGRDAYTEWGINFEDGAIAALMTPAPMKEYIENKSRLADGKRVVTANARRDERSISLPFHLVASSSAEFLDRYGRFCADVLAKGRFELETRHLSGVTFRLVYKSCSQFAQLRQQIAKFTLKVEEPDPTDREPLGK